MTDPFPTLRKFFADEPLIPLAIAVASPGLLVALQQNTNGDTGSQRRAWMRCLAYVLRMCTRATPFGLFATVSAVNIAQETTMRLRDASAVQTRTRPDMAWLLNRVRLAETEANTRDKLIFYNNEHVIERDGRLYITRSDVTGDKQADGAARLEFQPVSIKKTEAVAAVIAAAHHGATLAEIRDVLVPNVAAPLSEIERLIERLWSAGLLISGIRPDPLGDPIARLREALRCIDSAAGADVFHHSEHLSELDSHPLTQRPTGVYSEMREVDPQGKTTPTFQIDAMRPISGTLGINVLAQAENLADIFLRSSRSIGLAEYRRKFREKYQHDNDWQPLLEVVDADFGIGAPGSLGPDASEHSPERTFALYAMATSVYGTSSLTISATREDIEACIGPRRLRSELPDSFEFGFQVAASSIENINKGEFRVLPAALPCTFEAGKITGRFGDMLGSQAITELRKPPESSDCDDDRIHAELSYIPGTGRAANVCLRPISHPFTVAFGVPQDATAQSYLPLNDLWLCIEGGRLRLWSRSHDKEVVVHEGHMLNSSQTSPTCRLLSMVGCDSTVFPVGFDWGQAKELPMLPRVVLGDHLVISLARWNVERSQFGSLRAEFERCVSAWRTRWNVPTLVRFCKGDNRLPINLETEWGLSLLYDMIRDVRDDVLRFEEAYPEAHDLWLVDDNDAGFNAEFYVSMFSRPDRLITTRTQPLPDCNALRTFGPGSEWTYVKLYCGERQIDKLLERDVTQLVKELCDKSILDRWFFIRYGDPQRHVRVRFKAVAMEASSHVRSIVLKVCEELLAARAISHYALDTYVREIERYGGAPALDSAEILFQLSSESCITQVSGNLTDDDERASRAILSFDELIARFIDEDILAATFYANSRRPRRRLEAKEWRFIRDSSDRMTLQRSLHLLPSKPLSELIRLADSGGLAQTLGAVMDTLFHMHCNRAGLEPALEQQVREFMWHLYRGRNHRESSRRHPIVAS